MDDRHGRRHGGSTMTKTSETARSLLALLAVAAFGLAGASALTACNTVEGAGEDVQGAGEGISDVAEETQQEIFH